MFCNRKKNEQYVLSYVVLQHTHTYINSPLEPVLSLGTWGYDCCLWNVGHNIWCIGAIYQQAVTATKALKGLVIDKRHFFFFFFFEEWECGKPQKHITEIYNFFLIESPIAVVLAIPVLVLALCSFVSDSPLFDTGIMGYGDQRILIQPGQSSHMM